MKGDTGIVMRNRNWFWGLMFIALAAVLVLKGLGYTDIPLFNIIVSLIFLSIILKSIPRLEWFGIFFSLAFLYLIFAKQVQAGFGVPIIQWYYVLGSAMLISIGFSTLFKRRKRKFKFVYTGNYDKDEDDYDDVIIENTGETHYDTNFSDEKRISISVSMHDDIRYLYSKNLEQVNLECTMGNLKVYFDQTVPSPSGVHVHVECKMGNVILYIPSEWRVVDQLSSSFGSVQNHQRKNSPSADAPKIYLEGRASFGEISIKYI